MPDISAEFLRINLVTLHQHWEAIVRGSVEEGGAATASGSSEVGAAKPAGPSQTPDLDQ